MPIRPGTLLALSLWAAALPVAAQDPGDPMALPPQIYTLDPAHSSVTFRVSHLGFSRFTAGFDEIAATLDLDVAAPERAALSVTIPVASLDLPGNLPAFHETMMAETFFAADRHPDMTFVSTGIVRTGRDTAEVTGDMTIRGVTRPLTLSVRFNGGYARPPWEPVSRLGFSATAALDRSAFGMGFGIPAPGTTIGVGERVEIAIEAEFTGPPAP